MDDEEFLVGQEELDYGEREAGEDADEDGEESWERGFEEGEELANDEMIDKWNLRDY